MLKLLSRFLYQLILTRCRFADSTCNVGVPPPLLETNTEIKSPSAKSMIPETAPACLSVPVPSVDICKSRLGCAVTLFTKTWKNQSRLLGPSIEILSDTRYVPPLLALTVIRSRALLGVVPTAATGPLLLKVVSKDVPPPTTWVTVPIV
ncbi:MAG: hypothetical protein S4CHLAM2_03890 [Chlamydiales bacterium]|nr:hypothetical protein [Chlamydiales bacterium]